jgi:ATP synthase proteolipid subunit
MSTANVPAAAAFFGFMGATCGLVFACLGAAYGTAKSGVGICAMGVMRPELIMRSVIPVVMAGVVGIYGLIIAVIIGTNSKSSLLHFLHSPALLLLSYLTFFFPSPQSVLITMSFLDLRIWVQGFQWGFQVWQRVWPSELWATQE